MIAAIRRTLEPEIEMSEPKVLVSFDAANPGASMIGLRTLRLRDDPATTSFMFRVPVLPRRHGGCRSTRAAVGSGWTVECVAVRAASVGPSAGGRVGLLSVPSRAPWMG